MPLTAFVLGGADSLAADLAQAHALLNHEPDLYVATNHAGRDQPGRIDAWVSFHVELFPRWVEQRRQAGRPDARSLWTCKGRQAPKGFEHVQRAPNWGGSSGLLAVTVALELGAERIVLCGVPLTREGAHYDDPKPWRDAGNYRRGWITRQATMAGKAKSFGGYTAELLGKPSKEWLHGA